MGDQEPNGEENQIYKRYLALENAGAKDRNPDDVIQQVASERKTTSDEIRAAVTKVSEYYANRR